MAVVVLKLKKYERMRESKEQAEKNLENLKKEISQCSDIEVMGPGENGEGLNFPKVKIKVDHEKLLKIAANYSVYYKNQDLDWVDTEQAEVELVGTIKGQGGILAAILNTATAINKGRKYIVSIEYLGHANEFNIRIVEGIWEEGKQAFYTRSVNIASEKSCAALMEILEILNVILSGGEKKPLMNNKRAG